MELKILEEEEGFHVPMKIHQLYPPLDTEGIYNQHDTRVFWPSSSTWIAYVSSIWYAVYVMWFFMLVDSAQRWETDFYIPNCLFENYGKNDTSNHSVPNLISMISSRRMCTWKVRLEKSRSWKEFFITSQLIIRPPFLIEDGEVGNLFSTKNFPVSWFFQLHACL